MTWFQVPGHNYQVKLDPVELRKIGSDVNASIDCSGFALLRNIDGTRSKTSVAYLVEQSTLHRSKWRCYEQLEELKILHPSLAIQIDDAYKLSPGGRSNLLIIVGSSIVSEWSERNSVSIGTIAGYTDANYWWNCYKDGHDPYLQSPRIRLCKDKGCPTCADEERIAPGNTRIDRGSNDEIFLTKLLVEAGYDAIRTTSNHIFDILVKMFGKYRGLQSKHVCDPVGNFETCRMNFRRSNGESYPTGTLMIGVNQQHNIYLLAFAEEIQAAVVEFPSHNKAYSKYHKYVFRDLEAFKTKLFEMIAVAVDVDTVGPVRSRDSQCEYEMKESLKKLGYKITEVDDPVSDVDCLILEADVPAQLKCSGRINRGAATYSVGLSRSFNGKEIPYSEDSGFRAVIIQLSITPDHFLVLPKEVLIKYGFLTTDFYPGKTGIDVPQLGHKGHIFCDYWDRFDLLTEEVHRPLNTLTDNLVDHYRSQGHNAMVDWSTLRAGVIWVNNLQIKILNKTNRQFSLSIRTDSGTKRAFCISDEVDGFLIVYPDGTYYLLPVAILVKYCIVGKSVGEGRTSMVLGNWAESFKNNPESLFSPPEQEVDLCQSLIDECEMRGHTATRVHTSLRSQHLVVNSQIIKIIRSGSVNFRFRASAGESRYRQRPWCMDDNVRCFLFIKDNDAFWVVPKIVLFRNGYVGLNSGEGKTSVAVHCGVKWLEPYFKATHLLYEGVNNIYIRF